MVSFVYMVSDEDYSPIFVLEAEEPFISGLKAIKNIISLMNIIGIVIMLLVIILALNIFLVSTGIVFKIYKLFPSNDIEDEVIDVIQAVYITI